MSIINYFAFKVNLSLSLSLRNLSLSLSTAQTLSTKNKENIRKTVGNPPANLCTNLNLFRFENGKGIFLTMGTCVSIHRNPESAMKIRLALGSKSKKLFAPSPASTKRSTGEEKGVAQFDPETKKVGPMFGFLASSPPIGSSRDFGSKDETFFDTQAWLDSDCEDDFLSVNGEFTPSCGSTPYNQRSAPGTPQINKALFLERISDPKVETSPTDKKKKLSDLFKESLRNELVIDPQNVASGKLEVNNAHLNILTKSSDGTTYASGTNSVCSSERTPNKATRPEKEKKAKAAQCCLPSLVQNFSFSERKKHLSPAHLNGG